MGDVSTCRACLPLCSACRRRLSRAGGMGRTPRGLRKNGDARVLSPNVAQACRLVDERMGTAQHWSESNRAVPGIRGVGKGVLRGGRRWRGWRKRHPGVGRRTLAPKARRKAKRWASLKTNGIRFAVWRRRGSRLLVAAGRSGVGFVALGRALFRKRNAGARSLVRVPCRSRKRVSVRARPCARTSRRLD